MFYEPNNKVQVIVHCAVSLYIFLAGPLRICLTTDRGRNMAHFLFLPYIASYGMDVRDGKDSHFYDLQALTSLISSVFQLLNWQYSTILIKFRHFHIITRRVHFIGAFRKSRVSPTTWTLAWESFTSWKLVITGMTWTRQPHSIRAQSDRNNNRLWRLRRFGWITSNNVFLNKNLN